MEADPLHQSPAGTAALSSIERRLVLAPQWLASSHPAGRRLSGEAGCGNRYRRALRRRPG